MQERCSQEQAARSARWIQNAPGSGAADAGVTAAAHMVADQHTCFAYVFMPADVHQPASSVEDRRSNGPLRNDETFAWAAPEPCSGALVCVESGGLVIWMGGCATSCHAAGNV
jgi:hypothetical protein